MKTVSSIREVPHDALRAVVQVDGSWLVYERGDDVSQFEPTPAEIAAGKALQDKLAAERADARAYAKLKTLAGMSPAEVATWVNTNVTTLADAKDAIKTLAIAVGILARDL